MVKQIMKMKHQCFEQAWQYTLLFKSVKLTNGLDSSVPPVASSATS